LQSPVNYHASHISHGKRGARKLPIIFNQIARTRRRRKEQGKAPPSQPQGELRHQKKKMRCGLGICRAKYI
jgi:hypothetical protein